MRHLLMPGSTYNSGTEGRWLSLFPLSVFKVMGKLSFLLQAQYFVYDVLGLLEDH